MNEIERKWILPSVPETALRFSPEMVTQGYLVIEKQGEVRLRKIQSAKGGFAYYLAVKGDGTMSRLEENYSLDSSMGFELLWAKIVGYPIEKDRFNINVPPNVETFTIDRYKGTFQGLVTLEVEFPSIEAAEEFYLPSWVGYAIDVTEDKKYKNKNLARYGHTALPGLGLG